MNAIAVLCIYLLAHATTEQLEGSGQQYDNSDVNVVFNPGFNGKVTYEFYRADHDSRSDSVSASQQRGEEGSGIESSGEGSGEEDGEFTPQPADEKGSSHTNNVHVVFRPGFKHPVLFNHFRSARVESEGNQTAAVSVCHSGAKCFSKDDCATGTCLGLAVGKCNCGGCVSFMPCADDSACGGLLGACQPDTASCDCELGFKKNGVASYFAALTEVCNVKDCVTNTLSCFGLPCNSGICMCI